MIYVHALLKALERFNNRGGWMRSSHMAMALMLALFPFCISALSLAVMLTQESDTAFLMEFIFGGWPESVASPIENEMQAVLAQGGSGTLTFGLVFAIYFASNGIEAIRSSITEAYRETDTRPWYVTRALSVVFVLGGAVLIAVSGLVGVAIPLYLHFVDRAGDALSLQFLSTDLVRLGVTGLTTVFAVYACHKWLPGARRPLRSLAPGILLTLVLWSLSAKGFEIYMTKFAAYSVTYAGLAGVMAALVFLYFMAAIFVLGAEFNGRLSDLRQGDTS